MRTSHQDRQEGRKAPQWLEVDDEVMEEVMSVDEADKKVRNWSILPQDSISMRDGVVEEEPLQTRYEQQKRRRAQQDWCEWHGEGNCR